MKVQVEVVCLNADGDEQRRQVLTIDPYGVLKTGSRHLDAQSFGILHIPVKGKNHHNTYGFCT